jgi:hypothetical protein
MSDKYTILIGNELLGSSRYRGTYDSYGEAEESAQREADRSRSFATFQIYKGTPKSPGKPVGPEFRGKH